MSLRVPTGFFETILHFSAPGQDGDIITSFGWTGTPNEQAEQEAIGTAIEQIMGNLSASVTLETIDFNIGSAGAVNPVVTRAVGTNGEGMGAMMPINSTYLVQKRSALGGRRNRGRNYLPGVVESVVDPDGTVNPAVLSGLQANIDGMVADMETANNYDPVIFHSSSPFTPTTVLSWSISPKIATQRRRLSRA